jgi:hypothetical protein
MMWLILFLTMIATTFIFAICFPQETRATIAELKRQLRLWVIRDAGERAMQTAAQELFQSAVKAGHDPDLVKEILEEDWDIIRDRLGRRIADDILGEPCPLERYG